MKTPNAPFDPAAEAPAASHTPGPWRITGKGTIRAGKNGWVARVYWHNQLANAALIARAPEMQAEIERLRTALRAVRACNDDSWRAQVIRDALRETP